MDLIQAIPTRSHDESSGHSVVFSSSCLQTLIHNLQETQNACDTTQPESVSIYAELKQCHQMVATEKVKFTLYHEKFNLICHELYNLGYEYRRTHPHLIVSDLPESAASVPSPHPAGAG